MARRSTSGIGNDATTEAGGAPIVKCDRPGHNIKKRMIIVHPVPCCNSSLAGGKLQEQDGYCDKKS